MYNPVSTIRLQFNKDFTFKRLEELIPFFTTLGVKTIYASPVFKAVAGSTHGYDVIDPLSINPELGTEEELVRISKTLADKGIGWMQDIVPNHMAFDDSNLWLKDVLEKGPESEYKDLFDTSLATDFFHGPIKESDSKINYRRFFLINGLICLNMQSKPVFDRYHELIARLASNGTFKGLRVDHVDGLYDPEGYLQRLRGLVGDDIYIVVEKILEPEEELRRSWPIQGSTGYEFIAALNNLFTSAGAKPVFDSLYKSIVPGTGSFEERLPESKRFILTRYMNGELDNLTDYFFALGLNIEPIDKKILRSAIEEIMVRCPYYRFYGNRLPLNDSERADISELIDECLTKAPVLLSAFEQIEEAIIERPLKNNAEYNDRATKFYMRLMQFTGPLMAKGVEDTLMYTFNRFVAHNEVGDQPDQFGASINSFHRAMADRLKKWPGALSATASHDTKRGEDSRMRLNVLTDIATEWEDEVRRWFSINTSHRNAQAIDSNDEYLIYQSLIATFPGEVTNDYLERLAAYATKALREAKVKSNWESPDEKYESSVIEFTKLILADGSEFMQRFLPFVKKVTEHGIINSLSQLVLKMTCPGVPDTYQSCLTWDLSFVDPDNRRAVDYDHLASFDNDKSVKDIWEQRGNGHVKFWLTTKLLQIRKEHKKIFTVGYYRPLKVIGPLRSHVIAFGREYQGTWIVVAAMLHSAEFQNFRVQDLATIDWQNTAVQLPDDCPKKAEDIICETKYNHTGVIETRRLFSSLPVSVTLLKVPERKRNAGILMPVTSLPSSFPVGDVGQSARQFADFLFEARQKIWQMLPVNAVDKLSYFSPYSSVSSVAGNCMLISMKDLAYDGLLTSEDVASSRPWKRDVVDYEVGNNKKMKLLRKSWAAFKKRQPKWLGSEFQKFVDQEDRWLRGFSQFTLLQKINNNRSWNEWPEELRHRDQGAIAKLENENREELMIIKWMQFLFFRQMKSLRHYCNERGIQLVGDVPFYIGMNSADVWEFRNVFATADDGNAAKVAGVPPDYFNSEGQLWGMPVFNWEKEKSDVYSWWIQRLRKALEFFDYVRLDHFRAFCSFWSVPPGEKNAVNGSWEPGPGVDFFEALGKEVGDLRLIAEDLGDIDKEVYALRDKLKLPGMKVLQFGFGSDFPTSTHLPHNYGERFIAYPGTHDNNTTRGWFENDMSADGRRHLTDYFNTRVNKGNVAELLTRACYASHAQSVVVAMQDVLRLGAKARINKPSTTSGNWTWRMKELPTQDVINKLRSLVWGYER